MPYVALITGASSGIGAATARALARHIDDAHLVLVARRRDRLEELTAELGPGRTTIVPADLVDGAAPRQIARTVHNQLGTLNLLVNNAGARWNGTFAEAGWANVEQTMRINFDAQVRLTEALLPIISETAALVATTPTAPTAGGTPVKAPAAIVNVASTAARVARPGAAAYSASKFALAGWSDGLAAELAQTGVHVGLVNPGFIATEGFPAAELREKRFARYIVSTPERAAAAIVAAGPGGRSEVYVPRYYWLAAAMRLLAPGLTRRSVASGAYTTTTHS